MSKAKELNLARASKYILPKKRIQHAVSAEAIGHLGHHLMPPLIRGSPNSNNILYNIEFSSGKKKKKEKEKERLQTAITKSHQAMKARFSQRKKLK